MHDTPASLTSKICPGPFMTHETSLLQPLEAQPATHGSHKRSADNLVCRASTPVTGQQAQRTCLPRLLRSRP